MNNDFYKNGNIFRVKVLSFERLIYILINNGFAVEESKNGLFTKKSEIDSKELNNALYSLAEENNLFEENALFHQLAMLKNLPLSNNKAKPNDLDEIIYIDFNSKSNNMLTNYAEHIQILFAQGFDVKMNSNVKYHFIPFDKSSSMGRQSRISFISTIGYYANGSLIDDFYNKIINRAYLDLTEEQVNNVALSKRYAYRGLMLSGGRRITTTEINNKKILNSFTFNKNTVLLVQDMNDSVKDGIKYFTQEKTEVYDNNKVGFKLIDKETKDTEKTLNDGYGFIANGLADTIDMCFNGGNSQKRNKRHTSYQVRLPYVKGVVHRVDFLSFFKENSKDGIIKIKTYDENLNPTDIDYKLNELSEVQMIISESMFKVYKELKQFKEKHPEIGDAMDFYYKKVNEYNHSLFVLKMDKPDGEIEEQTTWNYQYMSTVELSHDEFEEIYKSSEEMYKNLKEDYNYQKDYIVNKNYKDIDDNSGEDVDDFNGNNKYSLPRKLLMKNSDFIKEPYFSKIIDDEANSIRNGFAIGRLFIDGHHRFLVGDPIKYLYHLINFKCPEEELLPENHFYVPGVEKEGKEGKSYPVLRNPHLSRNEDLALTIYFPSEDSIRHRYLGHLTGACIIDSSHSTMPADTIGGADFDGDTTKIYFNDIYANSIVKNRKDDNKDGYPLVINTDYVDVEHRKQDEFIDNPYNKYLVNMQTFNNFVGEISNLAFRESLKAYANEETKTIDNESNKDNVRLLGILTGVEVDSAKTGVKPYFKDIVKEERSNELKNPSNYFLDFKAIRLGSKSKKDVETKFEKNDEDPTKGQKYFKAIYEEKDYKKFEETFVINTGRKPSNVETLIQKYNSLSQYRKKSSERSSTLFLWDEDYNEDFYNENAFELGNLRNIIKAYNKICEEKNYLLHSDNFEDTGGYYNSLIFRAANYNEEKGQNVLDKLLKDLADVERVPYMNFYNLFDACTNKNLVYYYYPYFSNPYNDYEKSIGYARKWLKDIFKKYDVPINNDQLDFLLSDAMNIHYVLYNVRSRRRKNFEGFVSSDYIEELKKQLPKNLDEESINTFFIHVEKSYKDITNEMFNVLTKELSQYQINKLGDNADEEIQKRIEFIELVNNKKQKIKTSIRKCLVTIYSRECRDNETKKYDECVDDAIEDLIKDIKFKVDKDNLFSYWDDLRKCKNTILKYTIGSLYYRSFSQACTNDFIEKVNNYRRSLKEETEQQIEYYNSFKDAIKNSNQFWKASLNKVAIDNIKLLINKDNLDEEDLNIKMIKLVRAVENDVDKNQRFLFDCLGTILLNYVR